MESHRLQVQTPLPYTCVTVVMLTAHRPAVIRILCFPWDSPEPDRFLYLLRRLSPLDWGPWQIFTSHAFLGSIPDLHVPPLRMLFLLFLAREASFRFDPFSIDLEKKSSRTILSVWQIPYCGPQTPICIHLRSKCSQEILISTYWWAPPPPKKKTTQFFKMKKILNSLPRPGNLAHSRCPQIWWTKNAVPIPHA